MSSHSLRTLLLLAAVAGALVTSPGAAQGGTTQSGSAQSGGDGADGTVLPATQPLRASVALFKSDSAGTKFTPFKASKKPFLVTVRLYDGPAGPPLLDALNEPWTETTTVTSASTAPSDPASGAFNDPSRINGRMDLLLGATVPLPEDLLTEDAWFTTQVTLLDDGVPDKEYAESPRQPLGLRGLIEGQVLTPFWVEAEYADLVNVEVDALSLPVGAAAGRVLTSDATGHASWEALPDAPGVFGTIGRVPLFDSATSIGDSSILESGNTVSVGKDVLVSGGVDADSFTTTGVMQAENVVSDVDVIAGDDVIASDGVQGATLRATVSMTVAPGTASQVSIAGGNVTLPGDVSADDFFGDAAILVSTVTRDLTVGEAAQIIMLPDGAMSTSATFSAGQSVSVGDDLTVADNAEISGFLRAGAASSFFTIADGSVGAKNDLLADDDLFVGDDAQIRGGFILSDSAVTTEMTLRAGANMRFVKDNDQGGNFTNDFQWWDGGTNAGLGADLQMQLKDGGDLTVDGTVTAGGADLAEWYPTRHFDALPPGTIVAVDAAHPEHVRPALRGAAEAVLGIVSTEPGALLGNGEVEGAHADVLRTAYLAAGEKRFDVAGALEAEWDRLEAARIDRVAVALSGRVPLRVDGSGGAIAAGDRLGLGALPGLAARYTGAGPVVGVALAAWDGSAPTVMAFVHLDWSPDARWQPVTADAQPGAQPGAASGVEAGDADAATTGRGGPVRSGTALFPAGYHELLVQAHGLDAASQPVVTFYGDPGSRSWIAERGEGYFVVALERPAAAGVELGWMLAR